MHYNISGLTMWLMNNPVPSLYFQFICTPAFCPYYDQISLCKASRHGSSHRTACTYSWLFCRGGQLSFQMKQTAEVMTRPVQCRYAFHVGESWAEVLLMMFQVVLTRSQGKIMKSSMIYSGQVSL